MGCCESDSKVTSESAKMKIKKLRHYIDVQTERMGMECKKMEKNLICEFKKQTKWRAMITEKSIIEQIVTKKNEIHTYIVVKHQYNIILQYFHHFQTKKKAQETLFLPLSIILYADSILKDEEISKQCRHIKKYYPQLKQAQESMIDSQIMKHHKKEKDPSQQMMNDFILNLCFQEHLNLQMINSVGHGFRFGDF